MTRITLIAAVFVIFLALVSTLSWAAEADKSQPKATPIEVVFVPVPAVVTDSAASTASSAPAVPPNPAATPASGKPSESGKTYTSVIIEIDGLKLERTMCPKLRYATGAEFWGTMNVDYDVIEDIGMVSYCKNCEDALKSSRSGSNPLILKAIGLAGIKFHSDPVLSDADAALLLSENSKSKFLDKFNIVFVSR